MMSIVDGKMYFLDKIQEQTLLSISICWSASIYCEAEVIDGKSYQWSVFIDFCYFVVMVWIFLSFDFFGLGLFIPCIVLNVVNHY